MSSKMMIGEGLSTSLACFQEIIGGVPGARFGAVDVRTAMMKIVDLLKHCKEAARRMKTARPTRQPLLFISNPDPTDQEYARAMSQLYIENFESALRIVHIPTFWTDFERYWSDQEKAPMTLRLQISLVIAVGSSLTEHGQKLLDWRHAAEQSIFAAQTWLSGPLEKDRLSIAGLQVHCLTLLARQVFSIGGDLVWTSAGSLVHVAMQMGLHRDPKYLPPMTLFHAEMRRRLWATVVEMTVQAALDAETPARISFDEFDTESPANLHDDQIDDSTAAPTDHPDDQHTSASVQRMLLGTLRTRLKVLHVLNGIDETDYAEVIELSAELLQCLQATGIPSNREHTVQPFAINMLDFLIRRFLLHLHAGYVCRAKVDPRFYYSRKIALDAAMAIVSWLPDERFTRFMLTAGGSFRNTTRVCGVAIGIELITQTEEQRAANTLHRGSEHREILRQTLQKLVGYALERVRRGESNVKNHMCLCMLLAEAEAIETGDDRELAVARCAQSSVELCLDVLREQERMVPTPKSGNSNMDELGGSAWDFDFDMFLQDPVFA